MNDTGVLPPGACGPAGESVTVHPLTLDYTAQTGGNTPKSFNLSLARNLGLGGTHTDTAAFEAVRTGAKRNYTVLRANASASVPVAEDWLLGGRLSLQHSGDPLVPGEQFGAGGANSVRGYQEREVTGDRGVLASVELTGPKLGWAAEHKIDLRAVAFVDVAQVSNQQGAPCSGTRSSCSLASLGIGLRLGTANVQARLFVANALKDGSTTQSHDWRSHVALNASF